MHFQRKPPTPERPKNLAIEIKHDLPVAGAVAVFQGFARKSTEVLPCSKCPHPEAIAYLLDSERRLDRKKLIADTFLGKTQHCVLFHSQVKNPARDVVLLKMPLSIDVPGYSSSSILAAIVRFCAWQATEIKPEVILVHDDLLTVLESDVLRTATIHSRIYWMSAIIAKYASIRGIR